LRRERPGIHTQGGIKYEPKNLPAPGAAGGTTGNGAGPDLRAEGRRDGPGRTGARSPGPHRFGGHGGGIFILETQGAGRLFSATRGC
jgi:hypothetical protein